MAQSIEAFKAFVRKHPNLKLKVRNKETTWQALYEEWVMLGEDDRSWEEYASEDPGSSFTPPQDGQEFLKTALNFVKKINPNDITKYINNAQKVLGIVQMFNGGGQKNQPPNPTGYRPRQPIDPLFRRFDD